MDRRCGREQAFVFLFQSIFTEDSLERLVESAGLAQNKDISEFAKKLFVGVRENLEVIDDYISQSIRSRKFARLSNTVLCILRIAIYEIIYEDTIPLAVSINEAVELSKKYGDRNEPRYVHGVLATVANKVEKSGTVKVDPASSL